VRAAGASAAASDPVTVHELSRADARRIAVRAQLLDRSRPAGLLAAVRHLTLLQVDQTAAVAPSADLVAWSRLGADYSPAELQDALQYRTLIDVLGMIRPAADLALYRAEMEERRLGLRGWPGTLDWVRANDRFRRDILDRLNDAGPLAATEIPDTCQVPWKSSGWNNHRNVTCMLECMWGRGEVAVTGRRGQGQGQGQGQGRLWDLASRVYPDGPVVPAAEAKQIRDQRRLQALGILRVSSRDYYVEPADVGPAGEAAVVAGLRGHWRVEPSLLGQPFEGRAALLSPFDRLVFDRKRMAELFEFDYQLEMYKPAAKRRWGYYALPILYRDRLVGKLDATADREAGALRVDAIHQDVRFTKAMTAAVEREISDLAQWVGREFRQPKRPSSRTSRWLAARR
jgi:uncharacterized protein